MTGEMYTSDVTPDEFPHLFKIQSALKRRGIKSEPRPFDVYQGPYLAVRNDLRCGREPYACLTFLPGTIRVWYGDGSNWGEPSFTIEYTERNGEGFKENLTFRQAIKAVANMVKGAQA